MPPPPPRSMEGGLEEGFIGCGGVWSVAWETLTACVHTSLEEIPGRLGLLIPPYSHLLPGPFIQLPLLPQSQPILPGVVNPGCAAAANNIHPGYFIHLPQSRSRSVYRGLLFRLPYTSKPPNIIGLTFQWKCANNYFETLRNQCSYICISHSISLLQGDLSTI